MIVTPMEDGASGRVILQKDHTHLALQLAQAFGNDDFAPCEPKELMEFLVLNHDRGWDEIDDGVGRDEKTGLPYSLVSTPMEQLLDSGPRSAQFNESHHPYCGLLSSMHIWGLFNGRYGLSDKLVVEMLEGEARKQADQMLAGELARQERLKEQLARMPDFVPYIEEQTLMASYKRLQFFDTLSLHFNAQVEDHCEKVRFLNVPDGKGQDQMVELTALGNRIYRMSPFPFRGQDLDLELTVYQVPAMAMDVNYKNVFAECPSWRESIKLVV